MEEAVRKERQKHAQEIRVLEEKLKQNFVMVNTMILNARKKTKVKMVAISKRRKPFPMKCASGQFFVLNCMISCQQELQIEKQKHEELLQKYTDECKNNEGKVN